MNILESVLKPKSLRFKEVALSCADEIYGTAFCLSHDVIMAEDLTFHAYERTYRNHLGQFKSENELRLFLFRELFRTFLESKLPPSRLLTQS
jgi:hypothetical protein